MEKETIKEYEIIEIGETAYDTEKKLNYLAKHGWKLICSYSKNNEHLILTRNKKVCKGCGK